MAVKYPELMYDPASWATYVERLEKHIAEIEDERDIFKRTLDKRDKRIAELEAALKAVMEVMRSCGIRSEGTQHGELVRKALEKDE